MDVLCLCDFFFRIGPPPLTPVRTGIPYLCRIWFLVFLCLFSQGSSRVIRKLSSPPLALPPRTVRSFLAGGEGHVLVTLDLPTPLGLLFFSLSPNPCDIFLLYHELGFLPEAFCSSSRHFFRIRRLFFSPLTAKEPQYSTRSGSSSPVRFLTFFRTLTPLTDLGLIITSPALPKYFPLLPPSSLS